MEISTSQSAACSRPLLALFLSLVLGLLRPSVTYAQEGSLCYKPIVGAGVTATPIGGSVASLGFTTGNTPDKLANGNLNDYAEISNIVTLLGNGGVSVKNSSTTYPAGWHAGYVVELGGSGLLNADVLNGFVIQTDDGNSATAPETFTINNGVGVTVVSGSSTGRVYLNFKTTRPFNEVRLYKPQTLTVSLASSLRIYYATAFDPSCGFKENNNICFDQIAGNQTVVNYSNGLASALSGLANPQNIIDGNKNTAASWTLTAGTGVLSNSPFVGVNSLQQVYPAGSKAGFVIQVSNGGLLSTSVLNSLGIRTYLHGQLQDDVDLSNGTGILGLSLISGSNTAPAQEVAITTTKPYNEIRLVQRSGISASVLSAPLLIYYAFESGSACAECRSLLVSTATQNRFKGAIASSDDITNQARIVDGDTTNYATYSFPLVSVGGSAQVTVRNNATTVNTDTIPRYSFAGFTIERVDGLLNLGLLNNIVITTFNGTTQQESRTAGGLLGLSLINGRNGLATVGFKTALPYNRIRITINTPVGINLGGSIRIYYALASLDDDNDGVPNCFEACPAGNDALDSDGDGIPDCVDGCNQVNNKSPFADTDSDGIFNACDVDSDNDGIPDTVEGIDVDTDGDGIPNYLDLDSDNDGILDLYESGVAVGNNDANRNGVLDSPNPISTNTPRDTDGDGIPDFLDLDSDNDGIMDLRESGLTGFTDANNDGVVDGPDADQDGIQDSVDTDDTTFGSPNMPLPKDTDGDTITDQRDLDSDNDSITDLVESGKTGLTDANNDGVVDGPDADGDGIRDSADSDDVVFGSPGITPAKDTDGDTKPDYVDLDSDQDSISDLVESGNPGLVDGNNDGVVDGPDADGDGIQDSADNNDGVFGSPGITPPRDTDGDSTPDYNDLDSDGDGINDIIENGKGSTDLNNDGKVDGPVDTNDNDGIADVVDNKPTEFGGLGVPLTSDLTPLIQLPANNFPPTGSTATKSFTVGIYETQNVSATPAGTIEFTVTVPNGFSLTFNPSATSIGVSGGSSTTIQNGRWTVTNSSLGGRRLTLRMKAGEFIAAGQSSVLGFTISRTTSTNGSSSITVNISDDPTKTFDSNSANNIYSRIINSAL